MTALLALLRRTAAVLHDRHIRHQAATTPDQRAIQLAELEAIYRRPAATRRNTRKENQ
ncbi:hypothetical protein OHB04_02600 [Streptomyces sp. NBC_01775]|uniref:hypothetical protein n=1 Tax=Streptomyces sp. NBC_01775 TaxID=2975939 RepID=UPI002DDBF356|nr:hypothetical protein [Streptomyces sp. NBC_01775]WSB74783.1 hypothetical protein OHB04_02600 [Streptomyces sp. NBC_01775]